MSPEAGKDAFLAEVQAVITRADEDLKHALRWGWEPGGARVHWHFEPRRPWSGLTWWLDAATPFEKLSAKHYTSSEATKILTEAHERLSKPSPEVEAFWRGDGWRPRGG